MQNFWDNLDKMISAAGPSSKETGRGDRSECCINLFQVAMEMSKHGAALVDILGTKMQCEIFSVMEEDRKGLQTIKQYFDLEKYAEAKDFMEAQKKINRLGLLRKIRNSYRQF